MDRHPDDMILWHLQLRLAPRTAKERPLRRTSAFSTRHHSPQVRSKGIAADSLDSHAVRIQKPQQYWSRCRSNQLRRMSMGRSGDSTYLTRSLEVAPVLPVTEQKTSAIALSSRRQEDIED